jgi:pSer/pThr/pTyr-binding forkhead associated (FHA) protein
VLPIVEGSGEPEEEERGAEHPPAVAGSPELVVKRGPDVGARFELGAEVTRVGRHPESEILLDDVTVSRRHAEFFNRGPGVVVRDVGSLNGTYVNRERIEEATLADGDEVQIGRFKLLFRSAVTTGQA